MNYPIAILLIIISYFLGSIPNALIVGKLAKGIDIRDYGSKNMGATNSFRVLGHGWGVLVFLLDALKAGIIVLLINLNLFNLKALCFHPLIYGAVAVIGHTFPIFTNFKGGKGVASTAGIMLCYNPLLAFPAFITFFIVVFITKIVSISSLTSVTVLLICAIINLIFNVNLDAIIYLAISSLAWLLLFVRHIPNIKRLINKTENKIIDNKKNDGK